MTKNNKETFENAMAELHEVLDTMKKEDTTMEESIELYERSARLLDFCNRTIMESKLIIEDIDDAIEKSMEQGTQDE